MQTTYKQQMAAVKRAMVAREAMNKPKSKRFKLTKYYTADKYWIALNDAYSTLAALRLNESLNKK